MIMKTVTLDREKIYEGNLILVNEKNPIRKAVSMHPRSLLFGEQTS